MKILFIIFVLLIIRRSVRNGVFRYERSNTASRIHNPGEFIHPLNTFNNTRRSNNLGDDI